MKVKDLKEFINKYPDDMDVVFDLPIIDDWVDIEINLNKLIRISEKGNKEIYKLYCFRDNKPVKKRKFKPGEWEFETSNHKPIINLYESKEILLINILPRGKKYWSRQGGELEY